ncbi:restriction endonuclease subunit S [Aeromonas schubertii]|uniref:restriction endonuclease subunit S n=1 Tax=Aeromonas schubertii TaxID=652 RepID=UPI001D05584E|nr:restriction endonuclease subunit S [Aeromonas schubertii]
MTLTAMLKYDTYKNSGVDWLGEIPFNWNIKPGLVAFSENKRSNKGMKEDVVLSLSYGKIIVKPVEKLVGLVPESFETYQIVEPHDIIVRCTDLQNDQTSLRIGLAKDHGIITSAYLNLKVSDAYSARYLYYYLYALDTTKVIYRFGSGLRQNLSFIDFKRLPVFDIPRDTQTAIADFIDEKTAKIDEAIAIKEQQIARLNEHKQILIQQAITQGLDPTVPMKDSGVAWIGKIPAHWVVRRSKFVFCQRKERARSDDIQLSATQAYGVIPQEQYEEMIGRKVVKITFHLEKRKHVEIDDFVISMRSFQGGLERAWASGCIRSSYVVLRPVNKNEVDAGFFSYMLKLPTYINALQMTASFIRDGQDLNFDNFAQVDLFIPPIEEQKAIFYAIQSKVDEINKSIALFTDQITKYQEYKTTLINSAITGKIKVV